MRRVTLRRYAAFGLLLAGIGCTKQTTLAPSSTAGAVVPSPARVLSVTVSGSTSFYQRRQTAQLAAQATLSNGFTEDRSSSATWQSDNAAVASVSSTGLVTAGNEGQAAITATAGDQRGSLAVTVKYGFRTPDPPAGQRLPMPPNMFAIVQEVANQSPSDFANSCQEFGGSWAFMDRLVDRLRTIDLRYGYNGKLGDPSNPAADEVAYHYGAGPEANSTEVYTWDVIGSRCGPNPTPGWLDISGNPGVWITRGRF